MTGVGVVGGTGGGGRFRVSLACPDSEWLDPRRNVFELGGKLPPALRKGLEGTLRGAARAWKIAAGNSPGLVLDSTRAFSALHPGAAPDRAGLEVLGIEHAPSDPTARACLAACLELAQRGETLTAADLKQGEELAQAVGVIDPKLGKTVLVAVQTAQAGGGATPLSQRVWVNPTGQGMRRTDSEGSGHFGASRTRGPHKGVDMKSTPGQTIYSPTDGTFSRTIRYLAVTKSHQTGMWLPGIEIRISPTVVVQLIYVQPLTFGAGQPIKAGDPVGTALNIVPPYGQGMTNHIHIEIEDTSSGSKQFIDPSTLIPQPVPPIPRRKPQP